MDVVFGVSYSDDFNKAKELIKDLLLDDKRVLKTPEFFIRVTELGDSSVNIQVRAWVNSSDYWGVRFDLIENTKSTFDREGISFPFPQRDMNLIPSDEMNNFFLSKFVNE